MSRMFNAQQMSFVVCVQRIPHIPHILGYKQVRDNSLHLWIYNDRQLYMWNPKLMYKMMIKFQNI